jgi:hypothetical protein
MGQPVQKLGEQVPQPDPAVKSMLAAIRTKMPFASHFTAAIGANGFGLFFGGWFSCRFHLLGKTVLKDKKHHHDAQRAADDDRLECAKCRNVHIQSRHTDL